MYSMTQAMKTPGAHPVHKATIMPRGQALGYVMQLPEGDQTSMTRKQVHLGGGGGAWILVIIMAHFFCTFYFESHTTNDCATFGIVDPRKLE